MRVHRLVARAFLGAPPSVHHDQVNHKDGNRENNHVDNLEYVTPAQNQIHWRQRNRSTEVINDSVLGRAVLCKPRSSTSWISYPSMSGAARDLNLSWRYIFNRCRRQVRDTDQYEFEYADSDVPEALPGEEWRAALHPETGMQLHNWTVSSHGRVKSKRTRAGFGTRCSGYRRVSVSMDGGIARNMYVHRIVARTFLGPRPRDEQGEVNHKDGDPANNHVDNLEYVTRSQNIKHSWSEHLGRCHTCPSSSKPVWAKHLFTEELTTYSSLSAASRELGVSHGAISRCCRGVQAHAGRFEFGYASPDIPRNLPGERWLQMRFDI